MADQWLILAEAASLIVQFGRGVAYWRYRPGQVVPLDPRRRFWTCAAGEHTRSRRRGGGGAQLVLFLFRKESSNCLLLFVGFHRVYAITEQPVTYGQCQGRVEVIACRNGRHPSHAIEEVVQKRLLDVFCLEASARSAEAR